MGPPVRTVCIACLHSLELSSSGDGPAGPAACPYCGHAVEPWRPGSDISTTGDGFTPPPDSRAMTPQEPDVARPMPDRIGRFLIREPLGEGGYGAVFRAYDPHLDRDVALKVLKPNRLGEKALERFLREARAAARLDHPNIVGLHDAGRDDQRCWIAYQLVDGVTLSMLRDLDPPTIDESVRIVRDLALALDHAHRRGVFHRDLKPANVLIDDSGRARLTDFGLARRVDLGSDLTQEGTILGTPQYMSPEAASGRAHKADGRSDVYSLGVILYELIRGRRPADVPSDAPLWRSTKIATPPTPRSRDRQIPAALDRISMKALAFDPDARHPDARKFADALDAYLEGRPIPIPGRRPARRRRPKGNFAVGLVVTASAISLALGMSVHVATSPTASLVDDDPRSAAIAAQSVATLLSPGSSPIVPDQSRPQPKPTARKSASDKGSSLEELWSSPVFWIQGSKDMKIHQKGCSHLRNTSEAKLKELGDARGAVADGYKPCKTCLNPLNVDLLDRPNP